MLINVQLQSRGGGWSSRPYTYYCDIRDIKPGDIVKAPISQGIVPGIVSAIDVPSWRIAEDVLPLLKTIVERADPPERTPEPEQINLDALDAEPEPEPTDGPAQALEISADVFRVTQLPVIEEQLRGVRDQVEAITREAAGMVCTEETAQAVKTRRAELNKQFEALDNRRKEVKAAVMAPYTRFETVFKECITDPFKAADRALKEKIDQVEAVQKDDCECRLRLHFDELCRVHGVDFLRFEQAGIKIDLASAKAKTPKKLMDQLGDFVAGVAVGMDQIRQMQDRDEIMAEFKTCLNVGQAVATVQNRHRQIEEERQAAQAREEARQRQEAAAAKVDAAAPPVMEPPVQKPAEQVFERFTFTVLGATRSQLIMVREFLKSNGIVYQ